MNEWVTDSLNEKKEVMIHRTKIPNEYHVSKIHVFAASIENETKKQKISIESASGSVKFFPAMPCTYCVTAKLFTLQKCERKNEFDFALWKFIFQAIGKFVLCGSSSLFLLFALNLKYFVVRESVECCARIEWESNTAKMKNYLFCCCCSLRCGLFGFCFFVLFCSVRRGVVLVWYVRVE